MLALAGVVTTPEVLAAAGAFIRDVGFPIFVAVFMLWRGEKTIARLTGAIERLSEYLRASDRAPRRANDEPGADFRR